MTLDRIKLDPASLGQTVRLGSGGYAVVYSAPELVLPDVAGPLVFKEYKRKVVVSLHGLRTIVLVRERMEPGQRQKLDQYTAWPVRVVEESGRALGVVMPLLPDAFFHEFHLPSGAIERQPLEIQHLFSSEPDSQRFGLRFARNKERYILCRQFSYILALLHHARVMYGDISARNALFSLTPTPALKLVDCDGVRVIGTASGFGRQPHSPDWEPPEATAARRERQALLRHASGRAPLTENIEQRLGALTNRFHTQTLGTDRYKLGLFILRALTPGPRAAETTDPRRADPVLDAEGRRLLRLALGRQPSSRPEARVWYEYFRELTTPGRTGVAPKAVAQAGGSSAGLGRRIGEWVQTPNGWVRTARRSV